MVAARNHYRAIHSHKTQTCANEDSANDGPGRRRSRRIAAKIAKRDKEVLCRTIHPPTGGEDVEWIEEIEVPTDVPDEMPCPDASEEYPVVTDWATWFTNPFSPDDD